MTYLLKRILGLKISGVLGAEKGEGLTAGETDEFLTIEGNLVWVVGEEHLLGSVLVLDMNLWHLAKD